MERLKNIKALVVLDPSLASMDLGKSFRMHNKLKLSQIILRKHQFSWGKVLISLLFLVCFIHGNSQEYVKENVRHEMSGSTFEIAFPHQSIGYGNITGIRSASIKIQVDMNASKTEYVFGNSGSAYTFEYELTFGLDALDALSNSIPGVFDNTTYALRINNSSPTKLLSKDLIRYIDKTQLNHKLQISKIRVINPQIKVITNNALVTHVNKFIELNIEYAPGTTSDGTIALPSPVVLPVKIINKTAEFVWENPYPFSLYQLQVLRLYNTDASKTDLKNISAVIDWDKAINIDVPVNNIDISGNLLTKFSTSLTLGEGTGYYAWRVRPVGTYYEGGISNPLNMGSWSVFEVGTKSLDNTNIEANYIYFTDPDEDKNNIYSRIFTEDNKVKEVSTYANGLNQVKQTKTYLPSNNVTLTAQSVTDYSGRSALNTLPMPTEGKVDNYSKGFLTNTKKELYTANDFDSKTSAALVDEIGEMNYYNSNPDQRIPSADGVPFTQATYYDDPLNRLKEEGGPGEMHRIKENGKGKNVKYFYGTPSETELVRVFGKEAPKNESVSKMVKVDPNNIATITYTSSEGKILATCLSFYENDNNELDPVIINSSFQAKDEITQNMKVDWGFVSTKRIVFLQTTELKIGYSVSEATLKANCAQLQFNCNYNLDIIRHDIDKGTSTYLVKNEDLSGIPSINGQISIMDVSSTFTPGTYVIEKRLKPGNASVNEEALGNSAMQQIEPLVKLLGEWLESVSCEQQVALFQTKLKNLQLALQDKTLSSLPELPFDITDVFIPNVYDQQLPENTSDYYKNHYSLTLNKWDAASGKYVLCGPTDNADLAILHTLCCNINVPVKWIRKFNLDATPKLTSNITEIIPDFEGYAIGFFEDCVELNNYKFYDYMEGWGKPGDGVPHGTFNLMIYHMLTDKPDPKYIHNSILEWNIGAGTVIVAPTKLEYDECGNEITNGWQNGLYTTRGLFECWQAQLSSLKTLFNCNDLDVTIPNEPINGAKEVDDRTGDPNEFNGAFDDGLSDLKKRRRRKIKKRLSGMMRELSSSNVSGNETGEAGETEAAAPVQVHLVKGFLDCAGYSFVKILTPYNSRPLPEDDISLNGALRPYKLEVTAADGYPDHFRYKLADNVDASKYFSLPEFKKSGVSDYYYYPLANWGPLEKDKDDLPIPGEYLFKNIRNPIYAFKYFEYPQEGWETFQDFESSICYDDPNDCFLVENGFLKEDASGGIAKGPCCTDAEEPGFCFSDYDYPNLNDIYKPNDPRFGNDAKGKFKKIVNDFTDEGRIKCPYDHTYWNIGQRLTFYTTLTDYSPPKDPKWAETYNRDCGILEKPTLWYENDGDNVDEDFPYIMNDDERLLSSNKNAPLYTDFTTLTGEVPSSTRPVSMVEMEVSSSINNCLNKCAQRADEFRLAIDETLYKNCYDVGACKGGGEGTPFENVVPREDIDNMVITLVEMCKSQCQLNTFSCIDVQSRNANTPKTITGANSGYAKLQYGMGGFKKDNYFNCENSLQLTDDDINYEYKIEGLDLYKCKMNKDITEESYSWYQYTMMTQATSWNFELNLPSKCETIVLEAEDATEKLNVVGTTRGVNNFGAGGIIKFGRVDFGRGAVEIILTIAVPDDMKGQEIILKLDDEEIGRLYTIGTGSSINYREQSIMFTTPLTGVHDFYLVGGGSTPFIANIDKIQIKSSPNIMSNFRDFSGCIGAGTQQSSTYIQPDKFEADSNTPVDSKGAVVGATIISPAKTVKVEIPAKL